MGLDWMATERWVEPGSPVLAATMMLRRPEIRTELPLG
jgi:hypothetical protein